MTVYAQTSLSLAVDTLEVAGFAQEVNLDGTCDPQEWTNYGSGGWKAFTPGLLSANIGVKGFQDFSATGVDVSLPATGFGALNVLTLSIPGTTAADPAWMMQGRGTHSMPLSGSVGQLANFGQDFIADGKVVRGSLLHPNAARTASGSGTAVAFTPPTATQSLYASFHVLSVTGAGTITFTVQTDDNSGFSSSTTRITSSAFAAVGKQFTSVAGAIAGETHMRAGWTVVGFTSVTFIVAAGVTTT